MVASPVPYPRPVYPQFIVRFRMAMAMEHLSLATQIADPSAKHQDHESLLLPRNVSLYRLHNHVPIQPYFVVRCPAMLLIAVFNVTIGEADWICSIQSDYELVLSGPFVHRRFTSSRHIFDPFGTPNVAWRGVENNCHKKLQNYKPAWSQA